MQEHITPRTGSLPATIRQAIVESRRRHGWSQAELGKRVGLPQMHISGIETGRVVPRFDTLLDLVRALDYDLLLVPRPLVPVVESLVRNQQSPAASEEEEDRPLYAPDEEDDSSQ